MLSQLNIELICPAFNHEIHLLEQLTTTTKEWYEKIEQAFGFKDQQGLKIVGAVLKVKDADEYELVGATGTNYGNTNELKVMNYKEAMATLDKEEWEKVVKVENEKMVKYNIFEVVNPEYVPPNKKPIDFAWAMKKKPNRVYRTRLARVQTAEEHRLQSIR